MESLLVSLAYKNSSSLLGRERVFNLYVSNRLKEILSLHKSTKKRFFFGRYYFTSDKFFEYVSKDYEELPEEYREGLDRSLKHKNDSGYLIIIILFSNSKAETGLNVYELTIEDVEKGAERGLSAKITAPDEMPNLEIFPRNAMYCYLVSLDQGKLKEELDSGKLVIIDINENTKQTIITKTNVQNYIGGLKEHITHPDIIEMMKIQLEGKSNLVVVQTTFFLEVYPVAISYKKMKDGGYIFSIL